MAKLTEYEKRKAFYDKVSKDKAAKNNKEYQALVNELRILNSLVSEYFESDKNGNFKTLDSSIYDNIIAAYKKVQNANTAFNQAASAETASKFAKSRKFISDELNKIVEKDLNSLLAADRGNLGPLHGIVQEARSVQISIKGENKVGGQLSSRIPISNSTGTMKGFFTKSNIYDAGKNWKEFTENNVKKLPPNLAPAFKGLTFSKFDHLSRQYGDEILKKYRVYAYFKKKEQDDPKKEDTRSIRERRRNISPLDQSLNEFVEVCSKFLAASDKTVSKGNSYYWQQVLSTDLRKNGDLAEKFVDFYVDAYNAVRSDSLYTDYGIQNNTRIDSRNVAMSNVAKLIGCSDVIANSFHMTADINDEKQTGIFMENVDGVNINSVDRNHEYYDYNVDVYDNPKVLKQLADLQILDYICGNADRHMGNIMFQFTKDEQGTPTLSSIKGIDNDCSFGTIKSAKGCMSPLSTIKVVDERTARLITTLSPEMFETVIGPDITTNQEKEAAMSRLKAIKDAISSGSIEIVPSNNWDKHSLKSLAKYTQDSENIFASVLGIPTENAKLRDPQKREHQDNKIQFNQVSETTIFKDDQFARNLTGVQRLAAQMKRTDTFYIGSREFCSMRDSLYALNQKIESLSGKEAAAITAAEKHDLYTLSLDLAEKTKDYIGKKDITQSTQHGKDRMALARQIEEVSDELYGDTLLTFEEKEKEEPQNDIEEHEL